MSRWKRPEYMLLDTSIDKALSSAAVTPVVTPLWYVMRDLKRPNAKLPAYRYLTDEGLEVFTPMCWRLYTRQGRRIREERPFLSDLLFVHTTRPVLDAYVESVSTLQYRYLRGGYCLPMTVGDAEMERFIRAVRTDNSPRYYLPGELTSAMYGHRVRIVGGPLDGYEDRLLSVRGSRVRRLLVDIPNLLTAGIEVNPEYVQLINV